MRSSLSRRVSWLECKMAGDDEQRRCSSYHVMLCDFDEQGNVVSWGWAEDIPCTCSEPVKAYERWMWDVL